MKNTSGRKRCSRCKEIKVFEDFPRAGNAPTESQRRTAYCKPCYVEHMREYYRRKPEQYRRLISRARARKAENPASNMWLRSRQGAKRRGLEFTISVGDLEPLPSHCPILGLPLDYAVKGRTPQPNAASVDRVDNDLGYVPGNVRVISFRANSIKSNATLDELKALVDYFESHLHHAVTIKELVG